ncbi:hypothetical protein CES87_21675 [Pseudomonas sp. ERMR1:02]|nr:hypothetical protein CES87_21675 [Pseudomonas sp. ERMR1:02]
MPLGYSEQHDFNTGIRTRLQLGTLQSNAHAIGHIRRNSLHQPVYGFDRAHAVQMRRTRHIRQIAHLVQRLVD